MVLRPEYITLAIRHFYVESSRYRTVVLGFHSFTIMVAQYNQLILFYRSSQ